ncbi:hypothetical protein DPEC_G00140730 [Dallia pectoralis]|uniref:Uncharacterized protein n=1 Tax=Dallia pectoralis TaxID=75939 RepID=A0ACC2GMF0_DALPE|nr:hypothetical protein DPEC_G00140730 [Dallia pectoralis]
MSAFSFPLPYSCCLRSSMYRQRLFLWVTGALLMSLCWANQEDQEGDDEYVTSTPDYDYTATFDYSFETNQTDPVGNDEYVTPTPDYDYTATLDYADETDYDNFTTLEKSHRDIGNKASGIGYRCSMLFLGLAANQLYYCN